MKISNNLKKFLLTISIHKVEKCKHASNKNMPKTLSMRHFVIIITKKFELNNF